MSAKDGVLLGRAPHLVLDGVGRGRGRRRGPRGDHLRLGAALRRARPPCVARSASATRRDRLPTARRDRAAALPRRRGDRARAAPQRRAAEADVHPAAPVRARSRAPARRWSRTSRRWPSSRSSRGTDRDWFRELGRPSAPGTMLVTVSGAVRRPASSRWPAARRWTSARRVPAGRAQPLGSMLVGGYFGAWLPADVALGLALDSASSAATARRSAQASSWPMPESALWRGRARARRLVAGGAVGRQCGPCANGLPAIAGALGRLASGTRRARRDASRSSAGPASSPAAAPAATPTAPCACSRARCARSTRSSRDHERHGPCDGMRAATGTERRRNRRRSPHEPPDPRQPDRLHRPWHVCRTAARAHHARRMGLPDHHRPGDLGRSHPSRPPRRGGMPDTGAAARTRAHGQPGTCSAQRLIECPRRTSGSTRSSQPGSHRAARQLSRSRIRYSAFACPYRASMRQSTDVSRRSLRED